MEGVLAVVTNFAADFAPRGWALCNGQVLPINTNQALFSLIGNIYGGNGVQTFALPDLRSRTVVSAGPAPGMSTYQLGQSLGTEQVTLQVTHLPGHVHSGPINLQLQGNVDDGIDPTANGGYPSRFTGAFAATADSVMLNPTYTPVIGSTGSGAGVDIRTPYLAVNYIICLQGLFPSRN